jgi:conjugal transfer/entry exclusion protein
MTFKRDEIERRLATVEEQIRIAQIERDRLRNARHRYKHMLRNLDELSIFDEIEQQERLKHQVCDCDD